MLTDKRLINRIAILFTLAYMVSYMTRINYGAVVSEMVNATGIDSTLLALAPTGSFITYGIGQIISGLCGDKFSPKRLVSLGFLVTVLMNALIPICQNHYQMIAVWSVNGFAQAFMWPPIVKLMTGLLSNDDYNKVMVKVQLGCSLGTIAVYLLAPLFIYVSSWKLVFFFCAGVGAIMLAFWHIFCIDVPVGKKEKALADTSVEQTSENKHSKALIFALGMVMIAIIAMGMLRDGVTTWMPKYISDTYKLDSVVSILSGVVLPILGFVCFQSASIIYRKKSHNPITCAIMFYALAVISSLVLLLTTEKNAALSVGLFSILAGSMYGVNMMLICTVPRYFKNSGKVSTVSGVLNACTYVGSAISTYGIAAIAKNSGWTTTLFILFILAVLGALLTIASAFPWKRVFGNHEFE